MHILEEKHVLRRAVACDLGSVSLFQTLTKFTDVGEATSPAEVLLNVEGWTTGDGQS